MASIYAKAERYKQFLRFFFEKYEPECCFCGKKLDWRTFFRNMNGKQLDDITEHHLDGNHSNANIGNRILAHRNCHLKYHRQLEKEKKLKKYQEDLKRLQEAENGKKTESKDIYASV